ncbi:MAG TPA: NAD(P)H-dependent oxidoreductase [Pyrinomonadaceae bacterium]|jgi:chromate reductase, NAD(P)H dehydrogenase (quinone)|nr:NAD(P)H-dependent oxidoreductase [Pyrinomonadaceae bacterium]
MKEKIKILAFAGSLREHSLSKRIVKTAIKGAERSGAEVTFIDLRDYPMPLYNLDDHEKTGYDEQALRLQGLFAQHDGFLIASPEYNGSITGALKNAIDWVSRASDLYPRSTVFAGKFAAMMSSSPGSLGGVRSLAHLRGVLTSVGVNVLPQEIAVPFAEQKFAGDREEMIDEMMKARLEKLGVLLVEMLKRHHLDSSG